MTRALTLVSCLLLAALAVAQNPTTPTISQLFVFSCNATFTSCPDGMDPTLPPVQLSNGNLYGVTWWAGQDNANAGGTDWQLTTAGQISVLYTFQPGSGGKFPNGENPVISLTQGADGNLYGVTESGGAENAGVFYKLTPGGSFEVLHNFCSLANCEDGAGKLILASDGNFYGVNSGQIFRLTPQGVWSLVYTMTSSDGSASTLIQGKDGNFYGTGSLGCEQGTVFKVTPAGVFTLLHTNDAIDPMVSNLVQASDGNLYGAASAGVFRITSTGTFKTIHLFTQAQGGEANQLLQASDGNLWGISTNGGTAPDRPGTIFALTLQGKFLTGAEFNCTTTGCNPIGFIQGQDGNFYGTAGTDGSASGRNPMGTVFKVDAGLPAPQR